MKIGIDISQLAYPGTGVANYTKKLIETLLALDNEHEYILFFSSLRHSFHDTGLVIPPQRKVQIKIFRLPQSLLRILWNSVHIVPIDCLIGPIDIFLSSDWLQPPTVTGKKATILFDMIVYKFPEETERGIVANQKKRLAWVKKECDIIFCISEATKKDAMEILHIPEKKLFLLYPGYSL